MYHVHGARGEDPTDPWAHAPYPHPAVSHEPRLQHLHEDFARKGCQPLYVPLGIKLQEQGRQVAQGSQCATCDGYPCLVNAKSDAHTCAVEPALEYPNVALLTNAKVVRLETSASGREVSKVCVAREGAYEVYSANIVVVSAGAINSAALLLKSANDKHPNGTIRFGHDPKTSALDMCCKAHDADNLYVVDGSFSV